MALVWLGAPMYHCHVLFQGAFGGTLIVARSALVRLLLEMHRDHVLFQVGLLPKLGVANVTCERFLFFVDGTDVLFHQAFGGGSVATGVTTMWTILQKKIGHFTQS